MQLSAQKLGFRYGRAPWVFRGIDLQVNPGQIIGLRGPSGRGKTTLARVLAGHRSPAEGMVRIGESLLPTSGHRPIQLVSQHPERAVNPRWKMRHTLAEAGGVQQEVLDWFGIQDDWLDRYPGELSGGELQRFCVARALLTDTKYLIADEMTAMLDAVTQAQVWEVILDAARERDMGVIVISHEDSLIEALCSEVIEL